jgi:hypothetical protein
MTIQRAVVVDCLRALIYSQGRTAPLLKEDQYSAGYFEGYRDALNAVAISLDVDRELVETANRWKALNRPIVCLQENVQ